MTASDLCSIRFWPLGRRASSWRWPIVLLVAAATASTPFDASAQQADPRAAERAARRLQLQVDQLQTQLRQAQTARTEAEAARDDLAKKLQATAGETQRITASKRTQAAEAKALQNERDGLTEQLKTAQAALEAERKSGEERLAAKEAELTQARQRQTTQEAAARELQARFADQIRMVTECTGRNEKLLELNAQLIEQARSGRVAPQAMRPRDPVLGFGRIDLFNYLQDQRDLAEAQRFTPLAEVR